MRFCANAFAAVAAVTLFLSTSVAQSGTPVAYTDPDTDITFDTWTVSETLSKGGFTFGIALPSDALTTDASEFIGYLLCSSQNTTSTGWCGVSLGGYHMPDVYTGNAELTQISSTINATHYALIFRCSNCLQWAQGSASGNASTSTSPMNLGWAQAFPAPGNPSCPSDITLHYHDNGHNIWAATLENAPNTSYTDWTAMARTTVKGRCSTKSGQATTATPASSRPVSAGATTTPK